MIWSLLYVGLTHLLLGLLVLSLPVLRRVKPKLAKWVAMRYWPRPLDFQPELWVHAVSVGELQMARALLARLGLKEVLLTTTTQAGYKILRQFYGSEHVRYLPWDLPHCYQRLFGDYAIPPLLVVETEIWPQLFQFVHQANAPLLIINGRVSRKTMRLRHNSLFRKTLSLVTFILARGSEDETGFLAFGVPANRLEVVGNMKFDAQPRILEPSLFREWLAQPEPLVVFASISNDEAPVLAGSVETLMKTKPDLRVLWVPRHLETLVEHTQALAHHPLVLRSSGDFPENTRLVVLDGIGELSGCYPFAMVSLVGGSFNRRGGQNFLESLQSGTPVVVGPSTENFREETAAALAAGALVQLKDPSEVVEALTHLLDNSEALERTRAAAATFLAEHGGAIDRTKNTLVRLGVIPMIN